MERLRAVTERSARLKHAARVGRVERVLVAGPSKTNPDVLSGRTRQNKLVHFPAERLRPGTYVDVTITDSGVSFLHGELVDIVAAPRHKTRIPVVSV